MKKWTVMLIPHDRTSTRTLTVSAVHLWVPVALLVTLVFLTAFLLQRERALSARYRALETEAVRSSFAGGGLLAPEQAQELEALRETNASLHTENETIRAENEADRTAYREGIETVTARLNEVLEVETQIRNFTGLAPRGPVTQQDLRAVGGGKGGPPEGFGGVALARNGNAIRPPYLIYGMSRPSADLIVEEIEIRTGSLRELLRDMETERDRIERVPSIWPLAGGAGQVTSHFGYRKDPFSRRIRHHDGVDLAAKPGVKVLASAKGKVVDAGYDGYYGYVVRIDHGNGLETWYAHLSRCLVKTGQLVQRSDVVGTVGNTGRTTGPHLHYEVHKNGKPVNAAQYLGR
ncbi:MAG: peptidoglycan DD-metalloendopeptidase family protein [Candidatus Hydrogenedentes bacterium]|nr:peptidoglycan DD-metalloendopeptidase family protein [Candidatus Hydrogenedentota bacterium]